MPPSIELQSDDQTSTDKDLLLGREQSAEVNEASRMIVPQCNGAICQLNNSIWTVLYSSRGVNLAPRRNHSVPWSLISMFLCVIWRVHGAPVKLNACELHSFNAETLQIADNQSTKIWPLATG